MEENRRIPDSGRIKKMPKCSICKQHFSSVSSLRDHHKCVHKNQRLVISSGNRNNRNILLAVVVVALVLGGLGAYSLLSTTSNAGVTNNNSTTTNTSRSSTSSSSSFVGTLAPSFSAPTIDPNGGTFNLTDYRGKSNVLIIFNEGLSCSPCLQQMVDMNNAYASFKSLNVVVVGITADSSSNLAQWAKVNGINSMIIISNQNQKIFNEYGMRSSSMTHTFVLINTSGTIKWMQYFPSMYEPESQLISTVKSSLA